MQHIVRYGAAGLETYLLQHSLQCFAYDTQSEAPKAPWIAQMVDAAGLGQQVVEAIAAQIQNPSSHPEDEMDDAIHRSAVLKELAEKGVEGARQWLYAAFSRVADTREIVGGESIIALDGVAGFLHVVRNIGRWLQDDPELWVDGHYTWTLDTLRAESIGHSILEREAQTDADIARYLAAERAMKQPSPHTQHFHDTHAARLAWTSAQIIEFATTHTENPDQPCSSPCRWFIEWGKNASPKERENIFTALLEQHDKKKLSAVRNLWWCFYRAPIPRWESRLLPWIAHSDHAIRYTTVSGVMSVRHPELRQLAWKWIASGNADDVEHGLRLLVGNFEAGDWQSCIPHLRDFGDSEKNHSIGWSIQALYKAHPDFNALDALLFIYTFSPCSDCRERAVQSLYQHHIAPAWLHEECLHDSSPVVRELAHTHATTRNTSSA